MGIDLYITQRAEQLADRMLARIDTIRTPARRAQALRSALRKLGLNEVVFAQVAGGVNMRRALISAYGDYLRTAAGLSTGLGTTWEEGVEQAGDVLDLIDRATSTAGQIGETVADVWGAFGGGGGAGVPAPAATTSVRRYTIQPLPQIRRFTSATGTPTQQASILDSIPTWALVGGAAVAAGGVYYFVTRKSSKK